MARTTRTRNRRCADFNCAIGEYAECQPLCIQATRRQMRVRGIDEMRTMQCVQSTGMAELYGLQLARSNGCKRNDKSVGADEPAERRERRWGGGGGGGQDAEATIWAGFKCVRECQRSSNAPHLIACVRYAAGNNLDNHEPNGAEWRLCFGSAECGAANARPHCRMPRSSHTPQIAPKREQKAADARVSDVVRARATYTPTRQTAENLRN